MNASIEPEPITRPLDISEITMTMNAYNTAIDHALETGRKQERQRFTEAMTARVCFDHLKRGNCDHPSCFELSDLIKKLGANQ